MEINKIVTEFFAQLKEIFPQILASMCIFIIGWWISNKLTKIICKTLTKAKVDLGIISFSKSTLKCTFKIITTLAALATAGVNVNSLLAALSAAFVTVGIALKDSLSNIASGILVIINKPFKIGDFIEIDKFRGKVHKIELIFTTLIDENNKKVIIPNSKITNSNIVNCNKKSAQKLELHFSIKNALKTEKIKSIFNKILCCNSKILTDPPYELIIDEYNSDVTKILVIFWCNAEDCNAIRSEINEQVKIALEEN